MIRRALLLDTETTGLDPATSATIEVGCILYDVAAACPVTHYATLIRASANPAESTNRIPVAALVEASDPASVWPAIGKLAAKAEVIVAHNAEFDRKFVPAAIRDERPWVCSASDLAWPKSKPGASLVNVALAHDLGVAYAHRALTDCDLLARLLTRVHELGHDLSAFLERGLRPKATFAVAEKSFDEARNALAKEHSFRWDAQAREWRRTMAIEDAPTLTFAVRQVAA